jgi:nucleolar protein TMA23
MNAHALLTSQGWRGSGNSLHPTDNSIGLSRPLLVSKKQDTLGIGKKQHRTSDMWWMNAFDSSLKGLDTSKEGQVVQTIMSGGLDMVAKGGAKWVGSGGGLYASFVRGECLSGTITPEESAQELVGGKKRKREEDARESKEERKARKAEKKALKDQQMVFEAALEKEKIAETKEERKAKKAAKKVLKEQQSASVSEATSEKESSEQFETKQERKARKAAKKALKEREVEANEVKGPEAIAEKSTNASETKEKRRERKRLMKLAQEVRDSSAEDLKEKAKKKKRQKD